MIGAPFYLMNPIHGVIVRRNLPRGLDLSPEKAQRLSQSFVDNLIRLHRVDYAAVGLSDLGKPEGYLERQVRGWTERYYGSKTHDYLEVEKITAWMQQHMPSKSGVSLIHNDYKYDNVVLDPNDITEIVGVLDWEMCTIGDLRLTDLGTALAYWIDAADPEELQEARWGPTNVPGSLTRAEIVHTYSQKTGADPSQIGFYLAFARFKLAVIVQQIYYRYHQGLTKDERFASMPDTVQLLLRASLHGAQTRGADLASHAGCRVRIIRMRAQNRVAHTCSSGQSTPQHKPVSRDASQSIVTLNVASSEPKGTSFRANNATRARIRESAGTATGKLLRGSTHSSRPSAHRLGSQIADLRKWLINESVRNP